jgi:exosortase E/protease (VPEID-CTERM system)
MGDAGHEDVAMHGFHSEAGWILFNAVAIGFLLVAQKIAWFRADAVARDAGAARDEAAERNEAKGYLLPFLAVLATSLLTHAASSGFDWLYPLRLVVGAAVLWRFRGEYRALDWRCSWLGPAAGAAVFAMWLLLARWHGSGDSALGSQLRGLAAWQRLGWMAARVTAAVVTVPIAEELAFRGYLARRLVSPDVETVRFQALGWVAIAVSSLAFGAMHGQLWLAGTLAGVVFALLARAHGRFGEAVAAHATANLLLAVWVLTQRDFGLW